MGNASSIEPTKTIFLDIDGKKEKVRGYCYFYSLPLHLNSPNYSAYFLYTVFHDVII